MAKPRWAPGATIRRGEGARRQVEGASSRRELRPWLMLAGSVAILAFHLIPDPRPPAGVWGAVGSLAFPPAVRWILAGLVGLLAVPPVGRRTALVLGAVWGRTRPTLERVPTAAWVLLLLLGAWLLRSHVPYGDGPEMTGELEAGAWSNFKQPLDRFVNALAFRGLRAAIGADAETTVALVSTLAGAVYWLAVARLGRRDWLGMPPVAVWLLAGTHGAMALLCGHVESYSLLLAATLWTLVLALEAAHGETPLWVAGLVLGLAVATHLQAVWLALALPVAWAMRWRGRWCEPGVTWRAAREAVVGAAVSLVPLALVMVSFAATGKGLAGFSPATFGGGDDHLFVPLLRLETPYERFTMLSRDHLAAFGNELLLVVPVGLLLALVGPLGRRADGRRADAGTWVLLAAAAGALAYAFVFNPDLMVYSPLGVLAEWDLFAFLAVPVTLLGMWWLRTAMDPGPARDGIIVAAVAVGLFHTLGFILLNAGLAFRLP
ncbi:MAG: hypothetical protein AB2L07_05160 [Thermoanaerobaculaceae bacterium]